MDTPPRASSHLSEGGTPEPLSPQSRFKAQLAALESSDDDTSSSNQYAGNNSKIHLDLPTQTTPHQEASDESDNDIVRPRGKLAARMQRTWQQKESGNSSSLRKDTTGDCIDETHEPGEKAAGEVEKADNISMPDVESQEDDAPVARRRLVRKAPSSPASKRTPRASSPTLFVSSPLRPSPTRSLHNGSDSEVDMPTLKSDRFKAMLERRRQKRRDEDAAKEAVEAEKRAKQQKVVQEMEELVSDDDNSSITDDEGGRRLTQAERPSVRKASKKAIEEMKRETQRMSRNMQLAHEAKTRKKITKNSLFERFNFRPAGEPEPDVASSSRVPTPHSDVEMQGVDTPPSSPPVSKETATAVTGLETAAGDDEFGLPTIDSLAETTRLKPDKGKGKAVETRTDQEQPIQNPRRQFRVKLPPMRANVTMVDSDDELEITTTTKDKILAVFDMAPTKKAQEHNSVQALRALAQLKSPGEETRRKNENHAMTAGELQAYLYQKARQQAKVERDRRVDLLKAQGVVIQTAEERERQMQDAEDIVARARVEAQMIMQKEKAAAKKEAKENGEVDPLAWDDSEDDEYQASGNEADGEGSVVELSGSEDEEELSDEEQTDGNNMVEAEAQDGESEASADENDDATLIASQGVQDDTEEFPATRHRRLRKPIVLSDEEEEEDTVEMTPRPKTIVQMSPTVPNTQSPTAPRSVLRSAKKNFIPGLPVQGPAGLGLTQIFAGTMDDSQMNSADGPTQSLMPDFDHFPDSNFSATMDEPMKDMIVDSQKNDSQKNTQDIALDLSQSQMRGLDSLLREESTQISEMIDFTQDGGLQDQTPLKNRFVEAPVSTTETMLVDHDDPTQASPLVRRGRLRRRIETSQRIQETPEPVSAEKTDNVFEALLEGAKNEHKKRLQPEFDHKNSKAKEMVQEQAEESEDEYAGLGGADGEDSDNESAASLKDIIDDTASNDIDGAKLAALYAAREQAEDEKQVEKLFKDITTGMLRRKRGAGYDLDDSDDDGEARRRMKRRQFAKMQKALFSDERVKKIAENPGNQAFLRTIEDRGSDDEMDFLDAPEEIVESSQSQSQDESSEAQTVPDSQPQKVLGPTGNRVPSYLRRTKDGKKPSNIGEVRETLSDLLEEPHGSVIPATDVGSDSEGEENTATEPRSDKENDTSNPRRGRVAVVDRISLKRNGSSNISTGRLAFATASNSSFKVPALLRRATTNSFVSGTVSTTSSGSPAPASGFGEEAKIKKGAGKKSGVHAFARDSERRAKLEQNERKREERKIKGAEKRVGVVGNLLGKGSFE
ncbi:mediator of replication checkpoint 1 [Fusarium subglutinans]|uniref:Mediator of replication checkpoint 1 n=1 Tax=Gibberella subglutinans TaxID=42677 RepID=A0A8H5UTW5_GIBSU|nr:mediator of replication checkpoint 1 [Fusarium subglutinans]KAF5597244.1 mediator of replication checkpoint 1 [Fusarium subglutinans]